MLKPDIEVAVYYLSKRGYTKTIKTHFYIIKKTPCK